MASKRGPSELRALPDGSPDKVRMARDMARKDRSMEGAMAALEVIAASDEGRAAAKPDLLARYAHDAAIGPWRDPGCHVRAKILEVLRGTYTPDDVPLLEAAVGVHEQLGQSEVASVLRAHALVGLDDVDGGLAGLHAVRLLADSPVADPTHQAALTAVKVLATRGHLMPLYLSALIGDTHPVVTSECLRSLADLPASLLATLVERYGGTMDAAIIVGLFDLLLEHEAWHEHRAFMKAFLRETREYDAHHYIATSFVASRRRELLDDLIEVARFERDARKVRHYVDALELRADEPEAWSAAESLAKRL